MAGYGEEYGLGRALDCFVLVHAHLHVLATTLLEDCDLEPMTSFNLSLIRCALHVWLTGYGIDFRISSCRMSRLCRL